MEWIVKIEGETNQRIRIDFKPLINKLRFCGQYKPKNKEWVTFTIIITETNLTLENVQVIMFDLIKVLKERVSDYENLNKGFSVLKLVAFEENMD